MSGSLQQVVDSPEQVAASVGIGVSKPKTKSELSIGLWNPFPGNPRLS